MIEAGQLVISADRLMATAEWAEFQRWASQ
jgi:hypothetical protein